MSNTEKTKTPSKFRQIINTIFGRSTEAQPKDGVTTPEIITHYHDSLEEKYLFDFKNYSSGFDSNVSRADELDDAETREANKKARKEAESKKIAVKPKDVLHELETVPTPFSLMGIEEKLSILKDKEKLITQRYAKREVSGLI